jgi:phosphoribosyl-ATP pyrophosphohydrolase
MSVDPRIARLEKVIRSRKGGSASDSYVASLFAKGREKIAQKVGEEATETVIAALSGDKAGLTGEAADLLFHLLILLADADLDFEAVLGELERREGVSGIAEKAARKE